MRLELACALLVVAAIADGQEASGSITGTVVDLAGSQVPNAEVTIAGPVSRVTKTGVSGEFVISGLAPGTYKLSVQEAGFTTKDLDASVEAGKETSLGRVALEVGPHLGCIGEFNGPQLHETKLSSGSKSRVSGITIEGGAPLIHETITLFAARTYKLLGTTKTDQNGQFQFADLPPGIYEMVISSDGPKLRLKVRKGRELEVLLTWKPWPEGQLCL
jgi:hypothetical protein